MPDYELVRVAKGMVERLLAEEPQRVMLAGLERYDDGTVELVFRTPDDRPESPEERHHRQLHDGTLNQMPPEHE